MPLPAVSHRRHSVFRLSVFCVRDCVLKVCEDNIIIIIIIIIIIKAICNVQDPLKKATNALSGSEKCSCLYTMCHINNNFFSCVLKDILQTDVGISPDLQLGCS